MGLRSLRKASLTYLEDASVTGTDFSCYASNPVGFIEEILGECLTDEQKAIVNSVLNNRVTNVPASHGIGKSFISSRIVIFWVFVLRGLAISTAPTLRQVSGILWSEIRRSFDKHKEKLGGYRGVLFLKLNEDARAVGYTAQQNNSSGFQGIHHERLLLIEDEASGISAEIDEGLVSCATGSMNRILRIGNPITNGTPFQKACKKSCISIPAWSHPNVAWAYELHADGIHRLKADVRDWIFNDDGKIKDEEEWKTQYRSKVPGAISIRWIEEARSDFDEGSVFWETRVEARFPADNADGIILLSWLKAARARYDVDPDYWDSLALKHDFRYGMDVGDGGDNHAIAMWRGPVLYRVDIYPTKGDGEDVTRAAGFLQRVMKLSGLHVRAAVDSTGVGAGAHAILQQAGLPVVRCKFGAEARENKTKFANRKTQLYWQFREGLRQGKYAIAPLENEEYVFQDLSATQYTVLSDGRIICERKELTKKRLRRSPDSEAVVIALENPDEPIQLPTVTQNQAIAQTGFNSTLREVRNLFD